MALEGQRFDAVLDIDGELTKVIPSSKEKPRAPFGDRERFSIHKHLSPSEILGQMDLTDLHRLMDTPTLDRFLSVIPIKEAINPNRDISRASHNGDTTLLKHLLFHLSPSDCPDTLDNFGYKTHWAQAMGGDLHRAFSHTLAKQQNADASSQDSETLKVLLGHDMVLRTVFMNFDAYLMGIDTFTSTGALLESGLRYTNASDQVNLDRVTSLQNRLNGASPRALRVRKGMRQEVRALANALKITPENPLQRKVHQKLTESALKLGMEIDLQVRPLRFQDNEKATLTDLIATTGIFEGQYPRLQPQLQELAIKICNQSTQIRSGQDLTTPQIRAIVRELQVAGNLQLPVKHSEGYAISVVVGPNEAGHLSDRHFMQVIAERIGKTHDASAQSLSKTLIENLINHPDSQPADIRSTSPEIPIVDIEVISHNDERIPTLFPDEEDELLPMFR